MKLEEYFCLTLLWLVPISFGVWWVRARLGLDKRWFVVPAAPLVSRNFYFALPTIVLGFFAGLIGLLLAYPDFSNQSNARYFVYAAFLFWGMSFVLAYLEPAWMAPEWYQWLKKKHGDILPDLAQEAHQLGRQKWLPQVQTQAGLERWVEDFRRTHRL